MPKLEKLPKPKKPLALLVIAVVLVLTVSSVVYILSTEPTVPRHVSGSATELTVEKWEFVSDTQAECRLPDQIGEEAALSVDCGWLYTEVWLRDASGNETLLYDFTQDLTHEIGQIVFLSLPEDTSGATVLLRVSKGDSEDIKSTIQRDIYCGTRGSVIWSFVSKRLYAPLFSILCSMSALIAVSLMFILRGKVGSNATDRLGLLALMMFNAGLWVLSDSRIVALMTDYPILNSLVSLITFTLIPVLTLALARRFLRGSYPLLLWLEFSPGVVTAIDLFAWRFLGGTFFSMISVLHVLIVIGTVAYLIYSGRELRVGENSELKYTRAGFILMSVCSVAALAVFYRTHDSLYAILYSVGVFVQVCAIMWAVIRVQMRDYNERVKLKVYKHLAYYDTLTGLGSRAAFTEAEKEWDRAKDWVYVMMDVNDLKKTNDHFGHTAGDELLKAAARAIEGAFGRIGRVYRIGGDEFVAVLHDTTSARADNALRTLTENCAAESEQLGRPVSVAVGYSMLNGRSLSSFELFAEADARMYCCKTEMKRARQVNAAAETV